MINFCNYITTRMLLNWAWHPMENLNEAYQYMEFTDMIYDIGLLYLLDLNHETLLILGLEIVNMQILIGFLIYGGLIICIFLAIKKPKIWMRLEEFW